MKKRFFAANRTASEKEAIRESEFLALSLFLLSGLLLALSALVRHVDEAGTAGILLRAAIKLPIFLLPCLFLLLARKKGKLRAMPPLAPPACVRGGKILLVIASFAVLVLMQMLYSAVFPSVSASLPARSDTPLFRYFCLFLLHVVMPAVLEELFFRGVVLRRLLAHRRMLAVLLSALLFALTHFSATAFPLAFFCGIFLGAVYLGTGSVRCAMLVHGASNAAAYGMALVSALRPDALESTMKILFAVCLVLLLCGSPALRRAFSAVLAEEEETRTVSAVCFWSLPMALFVLWAALIQLL